MSTCDCYDCREAFKFCDMCKQSVQVTIHNNVYYAPDRLLSVDEISRLIRSKKKHVVVSESLHAALCNLRDYHGDASLHETIKRLYDENKELKLNRIIADMKAKSRKAKPVRGGA